VLTAFKRRYADEPWAYGAGGRVRQDTELVNRNDWK